MDLQELRRIREKERSTDSLQSLREDFYSDVGAYLEELTARRDQVAENAEDPFADPEVRRIADELAAAERTVEALYERRVGKIVKLASFSAADMAADQDGLTTEERDLFEAIVETIKENRARVLAMLKAHPTEHPAEPSVRGGSDVGDEQPERPDADARDDADAAESAGSDDPDDPDLERTTVRITKDVGEIVGVDDRSYHLGVDDVVTLPTKNAKPLLQREAAEPLE